MSDEKQQQQTGVRGTSAKTVVIKVNPLTFDDNHGLVKLVKQPLSKINLLEELGKGIGLVNRRYYNC